MSDPHPAPRRQAVPAPLRVVMYHEFALSSSSDVYQLTPSVFAEHLRALHEALGANRRQLRVTFDDAHRSQIELAAPVLDQFGIAGHFFAPASWVSMCRQTAGWHDLRHLLATGHRIGSHGDTHALLTRCTPDALRSELVRSRETLEDRLGCEIRTLSLPGGRSNTAVLAACRAAGYHEVYTSDPGSAQTEAGRGGAVAVYGRLVVRRSTRVATLMGYATGDPSTMALLRLEHAAKRALKRVVGDHAYQTVWRGLLRSPADVISYGKR